VSPIGNLFEHKAGASNAIKKARIPEIHRGLRDVRLCQHRLPKKTRTQRSAEKQSS
jgi:hypothetical protein